MVQNGIQCDGGLAGLTVADDELALTAPDGDHTVDRLNASLERHSNRLTLDDTGCRTFHRSVADSLDGTLAIDGRTESIDDTTDERFAHRNRDNTAGTADSITLLDAGVITQNDDGDGIFL